jgi:outer membrane protein, heavy metal efflux system
LRVALLLLVASVSCRAPAQAAPAPLTVAEAVQAAVRHHPLVSAAERDVAAARSGVRSARALANPEVTVTPGLTTGGSDEELSVRQPLELNGVRAARTAIAVARQRGAVASATVSLRDVVFATKSAYYELARARELLAVSQDLLKSAEEFDRITRRQVELGSRPGVDRTQTSIEVARARQQAIDAESQVTIAAAALNTSMGRTPDDPIGAISALSAEPVSIDRQALVRDALSQRAEIRVDEAERDALRQEARLARAEGLPDLAAQYRATKIVGGVEDAGFGLGITLPLLDYGSRRHRAQQADEAARAQQDRIAARTNQVRQEVEQALARVSAADALLMGYQQGLLDQSRRLLEAARTGFQAGQTSVLAVLEAQRTYRNVQTEYTGALVNRALALAELEHATGAVPASLLRGTPRRATGGGSGR